MCKLNHDPKTQLTREDSIYATGVYLQPYRRFDGRWTWRVMCFDGDSYLDGGICNPSSECVADTCEELLRTEEE